MDDIQVSIICNAYNHEKYIRDAMDMVCCMRMQKMVMVMKKEITVLQICSGRRKLK